MTKFEEELKEVMIAVKKMCYLRDTCEGCPFHNEWAFEPCDIRVPKDWRIRNDN